MITTVANDIIKLELNHDSNTLDIFDLRSGEKFTSKCLVELTYGDFYSYDLAQHTTVKVKSDDSSITVHFSNMRFWARFPENGYVKPEVGPDLEIELTIKIVNDRLEFHVPPIKNIEEEDIDLAICKDLCAWDSNSKAEFLLPFGYGLLYSFPRQDTFNRVITPGWGYSFPLYTAFIRDKGTLMFYMKTPLDLKTTIDFNMKQAHTGSATTSFCFTKKLTNYPREMHLYLMDKSTSFVEVAKKYRSIVKDENRFVSLEEKIKANPEVEKLVGSVVWKHNVYCKTPPAGVEKGYSLYIAKASYNSVEQKPNNWQANEIFDCAKQNGFDRVCVYNTGWQRNGYDSSFPTRFPINPERGSEEDYTNAAKYAKSLSEDYILSVHDNYFDTYPDSLDDYEDDLIREKNMSIKQGGIWRGGRAQFICSKCSLKYAQRDIPHIVKMLGKGSIYLDVMGNAQPELCFHPDHPQSHRDDVASRRKILKYIKSQIGSIATEGVPSDYYTDLVDIGAFAPVHDTDLHASNFPRPIPVPFWQLVYHDSVMNYISEGCYKFHGTEYKLLVALYCLLPTQFDDFSKIISIELRDTFKAEMVNYEFLETPSVTMVEDGSLESSTVAKSTFSNGVEVVANFLNCEYVYNGTKLAPKSFIIMKGDKIISHK